MSDYVGGQQSRSQTSQYPQSQGNISSPGLPQHGHIDVSMHAFLGMLEGLGTETENQDRCLIFYVCRGTFISHGETTIRKPKGRGDTSNAALAFPHWD